MSDLQARLDLVAESPVELVHWPDEDSLRQALARVGVPRVLLLDAQTDPPPMLGIDEDWVRLPADDGDVLARAIRLSQVIVHLHNDQPYIDRHRILHRAGRSIPLSVAEAAILNVLLQRKGSIVPVADIEREVWKGQAHSRDAVDAAIYRLRRRLSGLSLVIRSVRGRGFVVSNGF